MWDTESQWLSIARRVCLEHENSSIGIWNASSLSDPSMNRLTQTYRSYICEELTPGSRNFLEKPIFVQLVTILSALCGNRRRIFLFTSFDFWTTYGARWIHSTPSHSTTLRFILILSSYLCPSLVMISSFRFFHFSFYALNIFAVLATCSISFSFTWTAVHLYLIETTNYEAYNYVLSRSSCYFHNFISKYWTSQLFWIANVYSLRTASGRCMMLSAVPIWCGRCGWCETVKWQLPTREKKITLGAYQEKQIVAR